MSEGRGQEKNVLLASCDSQRGDRVLKPGLGSASNPPVVPSCQLQPVLSRRFHTGQPGLCHP